MAVSSAKDRKKMADQISNEIDIKHREKDSELKAEQASLQYDYDKTQLEFIQNFVESVSADTTNIEKIKRDFSELSAIQDSLEEDLNDILDVDRTEFAFRLNRFRSLVSDTMHNIDEFMEKREQTERDIENILLEYDVDEPMIMFIPFWVVGIGGEMGEEIMVMPMSERYSANEYASRGEPYVFHLRQDFTGAFEEYSGYFKKPNNIKKAKKVSVLNNRKVMERAERNVHVLERHVDNTEPDRTSLFLKTMSRFFFGGGVY
jgi:hypothetical protein